MSRLTLTTKMIASMVVGKKDGKTIWEMLTEKEKIRVDEEFPLNIRIFSRVILDITNYLLAEEKLLMTRPFEQGTVVEVGVITYADGLVDYLARISPDNPNVEDVMTMLLVETQHGKVLSTKLFTQSIVIYPKDANEWRFWLDEENGALGNRILTSPDGQEYVRYWGEGDHVAPMNAREKVVSDRFGNNTRYSELIQMMFARDVVDATGNFLTTEYVIASVVDNECVEILLGTPITVTVENIIGA